ncbi:uncharacterized protein LOC116292738 [Actinia tenebrosa]|uniref:Uncharacterized protein LOC116292738 n=1 Tax=Actinia tenebrosa TaxID=6105 RepID=A0A6P8HTD9_ACTTE|nr:uncharacterized protein LOC116292738 [Actinia tenebrosa]
MKANKKASLDSKVTIQSIQLDTSESKADSHVRLQSLLLKNPGILASRVYLKSELQILCQGYEIPFKSSDNKEKLSTLLGNQIKQLNGMPKPGKITELEGERDVQSVSSPSGHYQAGNPEISINHLEDHLEISHAQSSSSAQGNNNEVLDQQPVMICIFRSVEHAH